MLRGTPLVLVLDGVQNPGNLGALLRSAEAAGATGALLTAGCADPLSWKALRGSMGSAFRLPHVAASRIDAVLDTLAAHGIRVLATAATASAATTRPTCAGPSRSWWDARARASRRP